MHALALLAQTTTTIVSTAASGGDGTPSWVAPLVGTVLTPLGVFALLQTKALYTGGNHKEIVEGIQARCDAEKARADKAETEVDRYRDGYETKVLPALIDAGQAQRDTLAYMLGKGKSA